VEKGGLASTLAAAGLTSVSVVGWADEMRVGLRGQVRRVWGRRGVPVRQRVALTYTWRHLFLVVAGRGGRVWWSWLPGLDSDALLPVIGGLRATDLAAIVWDGAPAHTEARVHQCADQAGLALIQQPAYAPELNPAERLIEDLRAAIEGKVYPSLDAKVAAVEAQLAALDADPARVRRLTGYRWIREALNHLPEHVPSIAA